MADTEIVWLPVPRTASVILPRHRIPADIVVIEDMPLTLTSISADEAPVVVESFDRNAHRSIDWRIYEGRFYRSLELNASVYDLTRDTAQEILTSSIVNHFGIAGDPPGEDPYHLRFLLSSAKQIMTGEDFAKLEPNRTQIDGKDVQGVLAGQLQNDLLLIDGVLYHEAPVPTYVAEKSDWQGGHMMPRNRTFKHLDHHRNSNVDPWEVFSAEDVDAMLAYSGYENVGSRGFKVYDAAAIRAVLGDGRDRMMHEALPSIVSHISPFVGLLDDDLIKQYMQVRSVAELGWDAAPTAAQTLPSIQAALSELDQNPLTRSNGRDTAKKISEFLARLEVHGQPVEELDLGDDDLLTIMPGA